ncbi:phospholipid carrier-dependent glycosyltransferase [Oleiharenicola sp. Vm1]|uniref:phospholipid carrier-dependent glycosyltransferase n=1 Tax=Oleiharenicola sp. Vm1 TaxID=3398393 RepID=UPI0039F480F1
MQHAIAAAVLVLLALTLARALLSPPNTVDVLNYHLPRQLLWLQQGGLEPFVTANDRQNMMPPLAELIGLQFLALTGGDRWANLPQWGAYAGLALGLALLVRRLGGSRGAAGVAALLGLLLPMAYHEATSAKNDLLSTFWIVAGAVPLARWRADDFAPTRADALWLAAPLALAWLTKSTAMLFVPPLVLLGLWAWVRRTPARAALRALLPAALLTLALVAPFHARNLAWYSTPLGRHRAEDGGALAAEAFGPRLLASSVLRHASVHVISPWAAWNRRWLDFVARAHAWLGVDPDDRRTTLWVLKFEVDYAPGNESYAGAPAHLLLGLPVLLGLAAGLGRDAAARRARWLAQAVLAGALLFCAALKWQPWAARLELPLFALGTAAVVVALESWNARARRGPAALAVAGAALAWWPGADTWTRPLWGRPAVWETPRELGYYRLQPRLVARDVALADVVAESGVRRLALQNVHDIQYPLMRLLQRRRPELRFAGAPAGEREPPDGVLLFDLGRPQPLYARYAGRADWRLVGDGFGDGLYLPVERVRALGWWNRLPAFSGWHVRKGLPLTDCFAEGRGQFVARELRGDENELGYVALGRPLQLHVAVRRTRAAPPALQLRFLRQGRELAVVDCGTRDSVEFDLALPAGHGEQALAIRASAGAGDSFVFTRLQLNDAP